VFAKAKTLHVPEDFSLELGWVYVQPAARDQRLSSRLVRRLVQELGADSVYATSRVDNEKMHAALERVGFKKSGAPYPSALNAPQIQLFVRSVT